VVVERPAPPAGVVLPAGSVGSGGGSLVVVALLVVVLVGGSVVLVGGGPVVGGTVPLVGGRCRGLVEGGAGAVVEVVAGLLGGTITARLRVVVDELVELSGETSWRCGTVVVVVVVCAVALATWPGEVTKPTMLPPIAPISIAVTTLTQRRAATNEIGRNPEPPGSSVLTTMISAGARVCSNILEQTLPPAGVDGARHHGPGGAGPPPEPLEEAP
jgi:hypothetical protein